MKGVNAILHIASPCHFDATDPKDIIEPAIAATLNLLRSCLRSDNTVRRVVITSSSGAVYGTYANRSVLDESDWNEESLSEVETKGKKVEPYHSYGASKVLAERTAWALMEQRRHDAQFDLVVVNPPWVFGPTLTPEHITLSLGHWRDAILGINSNPATNPVVPEYVLHARDPFLHC